MSAEGSIEGIAKLICFFEWWATRRSLPTRVSWIIYAFRSLIQSPFDCILLFFFHLLLLLLLVLTLQGFCEAGMWLELLLIQLQLFKRLRNVRHEISPQKLLLSRALFLLREQLTSEIVNRLAASRQRHELSLRIRAEWREVGYFFLMSEVASSLI